MPFLLLYSAVLFLSLFNGRAVFLPKIVNCLGHTACNSGDEEKNYLAGSLMLCFNKQEKNTDQKEAVCICGHENKWPEQDLREQGKRTFHPARNFRQESVSRANLCPWHEQGTYWLPKRKSWRVMKEN